MSYTYKYNSLNNMRTANIMLFLVFSISASSIALAQSVPETLKSNNCITCHTSNKTLMGPSWQDIAKKYKNDANASNTLENSISRGTSNKWGKFPMPASPQLKGEEVNSISKWILQQQ